MPTLSIFAIQNTQIIMLHVNSVGMTSACDPASMFACPQCGMHHLVYMRYLWLEQGKSGVLGKHEETGVLGKSQRLSYEYLILASP